MMKDASRGPDLNEKWLQQLVGKVALQLNVKQEMDILSSEIPKETKEIDYLKDRIAAAHKRLSETESAILKMQRRVREPKESLTSLEYDRRLAQAEYGRLKETEADMVTKLSDLPKMKVEIGKLTETVKASAQHLASIHTEQHEAVLRKEKLGGASNSVQKELQALEEEIAIVRNTRDVIGGIRPEGFDADTFETIQDDVEKTLENYIDEIEGEIARIKTEISSSNERLDSMKSQEEELLSKKRRLPETIEKLGTELGDDQDRETLTAELKELEGEKMKLSAEVDEKNENIARQEAAIGSVDKRIEMEQSLNRELNERHSYLASRKQEMDGFDNAADEIQRLYLEIKRLNADSELNAVLFKTISELNSDAEPIGSKLRESIEGYNRAFDEFEREINDLLSS